MGEHLALDIVAMIVKHVASNRSPSHLLECLVISIDLYKVTQQHQRDTWNKISEVCMGMKMEQCTKPYACPWLCCRLKSAL